MRTLRRVLLIVLAAYLLSGVTQVLPEEQAVVYRFGKPVARLGPGLHINLPWGIDRIERVPVTTVRQVTIGFQPGTDYTSGPTPTGQLLTADQNLVNVQLAVDYNVSTVEGDLEQYVMHRETAEAVLRRAVDSLAAEWASGQPVDHVLLTGTAELPRWLMARLPEELDPYRLGVQVQQVSVAYLAPPDEVKSAFEEVNRAQSNMLTQENRARQEADRRKRQAEAEQYRQEQLAAGYRDEKLSLAQADAEAFDNRYAQYQKLREVNPDILTAIWWEEVGKMLVGMKQRGRIDLLDNHLSSDGLDITQFLPPRGGR